MGINLYQKMLSAIKFSFLIFYLLFVQIYCKKDRTTDETEIIEWKKHPRETNVVNFVRLLVLRLIYGFAHMLGFEEGISEIGDGALVPPGVDDYGFDDDNRDYNDYY